MAHFDLHIYFFQEPLLELIRSFFKEFPIKRSIKLPKTNRAIDVWKMSFLFWTCHLDAKVRLPQDMPGKWAQPPTSWIC